MQVDANPSAHVGQQVTLEGTAFDAFSGAVVMLSDDMPVYVSGLEEWDDHLFRKRVHVTGTLRERELAPDPETNDAGEHSHGKPGSDYVIDDASWEVVG